MKHEHSGSTHQIGEPVYFWKDRVADKSRYSRARRALIVEDEPVFSEHLTHAIEHLGPEWSSYQFSTGVAAMDHIEAKGFFADIALVDLGLPDIGGLEIIRALRARNENVPILVISVIEIERMVLSAIRLGACGYLLKDQKQSLITEGIRDVLNGKFPISPALTRCLFRLAGSPLASNLCATLTSVSAWATWISSSLFGRTLVSKTQKMMRPRKRPFSFVLRIASLLQQR